MSYLHRSAFTYQTFFCKISFFALDQPTQNKHSKYIIVSVDVSFSISSPRYVCFHSAHFCTYSFSFILYTHKKERKKKVWLGEKGGIKGDFWRCSSRAVFFLKKDGEEEKRRRGRRRRKKAFFHLYTHMNVIIYKKELCNDLLYCMYSL